MALVANEATKRACLPGEDHSVLNCHFGFLQESSANSVLIELLFYMAEREFPMQGLGYF